MLFNRYNSWEGEDHFETCPLLLLQYFGKIDRSGGVALNILAGKLLV